MHSYLHVELFPGDICYTWYMVTSLYVIMLSIERFMVIASLYMVTDNSATREIFLGKRDDSSFVRSI